LLQLKKGGLRGEKSTGPMAEKWSLLSQTPVPSKNQKKMAHVAEATKRERVHDERYSDSGVEVVEGIL